MLLLKLRLIKGSVRHSARVIVEGVHGGDGKYSLVITPIKLCLRALIGKHLKLKEKFIEFISVLYIKHMLCYI